MTHEPFSFEILMAYADGALPPDEARRVAERLAGDPQAQAQVAALRHAGEQAATAFAQDLEQPVPPALRAAVERSIAAARATRRAPVPAPAASAARWWQRFGLHLQPRFALAAGLLSLIAGGAAYWLGATLHPGAAQTANVPFGVLVLAPDTLRALTGVLDALPSGEERTLPDGRRVELVATFRAADGVLCREFNLHAAGGLTRAVACRGEQWQATFAVAASAAAGYTPAAGPAAALDAYVESVGGTPLGPAEEAEALRGG
jgi:hypothetical protein